MSATLRDRLWNEVWSEYDARRPRPRPVARPTVRHPRAPAHHPRAPARRFAPGRPALAALALLLLLLGYAVPPVLAAMRTAEGLRHGAGLPLADPTALVPALHRALLEPDALGALGPDAPPFLGEMARAVAEGLAAPLPLADALRRRLPDGEAPLTGLRPVGWRSWQARYGADGPRVTLTLADPLSLRWEVAAVALPPPRPASGW